MSNRPGLLRAVRRELGPLDTLLLAIPAAFAIRYVPGWRNETLLFIASGAAIVPLAGWMGRATEQLGTRAGQGVGGLLNATFGNAAELIIALFALSKGLTTVVKASLTGSILGNILLVLGASFLAGGIRFSKQTFNKTAARIATTSLGLAAIGLIIPTIFHVTASGRPDGWSPRAEQHLSLAVSGVLLLSYILWLGFSLITHKQLFAGEAEPEAAGGERRPPWSIGKAVTILAGATLLVAFASEFLVGSVEAARKNLGMTETFVGVVIVATVGNAAEHASAVMVALKNKLDLSLGIAIGSSLQIALFVTPVLVFASYAIGRPMDLEFSLPEIAAVALAVWIVGEISGDGECNWFEGVQLLSVYLIVGILFYFLPEPARTRETTPPASLDSALGAHESAGEGTRPPWQGTAAAKRPAQARPAKIRAVRVALSVRTGTASLLPLGPAAHAAGPTASLGIQEMRECSTRAALTPPPRAST